MKNNLVIYRKYRPKTFSEVIGQEHLIKTITYAIKQGRPAHAYLFSGTRGVGKTTIARLIIKAINCQNRGKGFEPCNKCVSCLSIDRNAAVDLLELDAASHRGIDEAKSLIESVKYPPVESAYKIFIIDEVHMLTKEAFNSLLKTLEEPPPYVIFILATTEPQKIPQTIISRCQYFELKRLKQDQIKQKIKIILKKENVKMDKKSIDFISRSGRGSLRDMESLLERIISQSEKKISWKNLEEILGIVSPEIIRDFLKILLKKDAKGSLQFIHSVFERGKDIVQFNTQIINYLRLIILGKVDKGLLKVHYLDIQEEIDIVNLGKTVNEKKLLKLIDIFSRAERDVNKYPLEQMSTEIAAIDGIENLK
jgi:DNA polymerase-3 subunit gamma/tau